MNLIEKLRFMFWPTTEQWKEQARQNPASIPVPAPRTAATAPSAPAPSVAATQPLTVMQIALAVFLGNLLTALVVGACYLLLTAK